jgi:hypothetical protein
MDGAQGVEQVFGAPAIDLSDKAQSDVQLGIALPPRASDAAHKRQEAAPDLKRRADRDEETVHGAHIGSVAACVSLCSRGLKVARDEPIMSVSAPVKPMKEIF